MSKPPTKNYPTWGYRTHREFKAAKRADMRAALSAINNRLRVGCAWCPEFKRLEAAMKEIEDVARSWSEKEWGR